MKRVLKALGIGVIVFVGVTGGLLHVSESIPGNAKIWIYPSGQAWSPDSWFMDREFKTLLQDPERSESARKWLDDRRQASYSDVKNGGKYDGYQAFPVLLEEPGNILRGWNGSLLMSWFFRKPRWNSDGSWNW